MKSRLNLVRTRMHKWEYNDFDKDGYPVAYCNSKIQLYPRVPEKASRAFLPKCKICFKTINRNTK